MRDSGIVEAPHEPAVWSADILCACYDSASRLSSVTDGTNSATYSYLANSPLVDHITFQQNSATRIHPMRYPHHSVVARKLGGSGPYPQWLRSRALSHGVNRTNQYDVLNRLTSVAFSSSASFSSSHAYTYNSASPREILAGGTLPGFARRRQLDRAIWTGSALSHGASQRTRVDVGGASSASPTYWLYAYDALGQVTSGKRYWADSTPVAGQHFEYAFDDIGNRTGTQSGGDGSGANLRTASYGANFLNQYTNCTVPGYRHVLGMAHTNAVITVNSNAAARHGEYFWAELGADNSSGAVWLGVTNLAVLAGGRADQSDLWRTNTGHLLLPQTPEAFTHDADGNRTADGRWTYTWNGSPHEIIVRALVRKCKSRQWGLAKPPQLIGCLISRGRNRLIALETASGTVAAGKPAQRLEFTYDHQGRRIRKRVYGWDQGSGDWVLGQDTRFLYDGWNLVASFNSFNQSTNLTLSQSFTWGLDLSGSLQGAGGVGGLLAISVKS